MALTFVFADMGAEIVLIDASENGIRQVIAHCDNPLWKAYCDAWKRDHPGSVPSKHGGTMMEIPIAP